MKLEEIRKQIDAIDREIVSLLAKRFQLAKKSAKEKKARNLPIKNKGREAEVIQLVQKLASQKNLQNRFITNLYKNIINESIRIQKQDTSE